MSRRTSESQSVPRSVPRQQPQDISQGCDHCQKVLVEEYEDVYIRGKALDINTYVLPVKKQKDVVAVETLGS